MPFVFFLIAVRLLQRERQEGAIKEEIFENEQYIPIRGWASRGSLLPTERRRYSTRDGSQSFNDFPTMHLPPGQQTPKPCLSRMHFAPSTGLDAVCACLQESKLSMAADRVAPPESRVHLMRPLNFNWSCIQLLK